MIIQDQDGFKKVIAAKFYDKGEKIIEITGKEISEPNRYSVQLAPNLHIDVAEPIMYINHHCNGNIEIKDRYFIALKSISKGEEITFNYNLSEDVLAEAFECNICGQKVKGKQFLLEFPCKL